MFSAAANLLPILEPAHIGVCVCVWVLRAGSLTFELLNDMD